MRRTLALAALTLAGLATALTMNSQDKPEPAPEPCSPAGIIGPHQKA